MTIGDLRQKQALPLEAKIIASKQRIKGWYEHWNGDVYISNSGGVDSTVLSHLVHSLYPDVPDVYCDTGLEYPELRDFIMSKPNVIVLKPSLYNRHTRQYENISFPQVISRYGYPLISKEQAAFIQEYNTTNSDKLKQIRLNGNKYGRGKISKRWQKFIEPTCDVCVGDKCCDIMKKNPSKRFEHETGLHPFIGTMTNESAQRESNWLKFGCNAFDKNRPTSNPLSFWTKSDVLHYIVKYNIPYVKEIYGDIVEKDGVYTTTKQKRTGCIFCGFGCHLEKEPNKFQTLATINPQLYDYCMRGGKYDESTGKWVPDKGLGMAKVLDFINVKWWNDGDEAKRDEYRAKYKEKEEIEHSRKKSSQTD